MPPNFASIVKFPVACTVIAGVFVALTCFDAKIIDELLSETSFGST